MTARRLSSTAGARALAGEVMGTFALLLAAAGGPTMAAVGDGSPGRAALAVAPGATIVGLTYVWGPVSGAHFNPAVTLAFALRRDLPWRWTIPYAAAQLVGGILACLLLRALFGDVGDLGATLPGPRTGEVTAALVEGVITAVLIVTILRTSSGGRNVGHNSALAVGGWIAVAGVIAGAVSGASMNPVRSLAPDVVRGDPSGAWIYVVGPLAGATVAALLVRPLFGRPTSAERDAAIGDVLSGIHPDRRGPIDDPPGTRAHVV
jgi:aquaporin Z